MFFLSFFSNVYVFVLLFCVCLLYYVKYWARTLTMKYLLVNQAVVAKLVRASYLIGILVNSRSRVQTRAFLFLFWDNIVRVRTNYFAIYVQLQLAQWQSSWIKIQISWVEISAVPVQSKLKRHIRMEEPQLLTKQI